MTYLRITVRFLDDRYHGLLGRKGPPEWPPSPFRLFSAIVAGVARRGEIDTPVGKSLEWLQSLEPPIIIAPRAKTGQAITRFVPNNDGDKKLDRQERLTAKRTIPTLMLLGSGEKPEVHYLWDITRRSNVPLDRIGDAARSLTTLGWGVDMAFADAKAILESEAQELMGVRWHPKPKVWQSEGMLRMPTVDAEYQQCTLCDLKHCHETAMARIEHGEPLHTVDKPRVFERVFYASIERPLGRPCRAFELRKRDGDRDCYPHRKLIHIAGMVRHLAIEAMKHDRPRGVNADWVETYIAGHRKGSQVEAGVENKCREDADENGQREAFVNSDEHGQLSYLPLPSIGHEHADPGIRRVMIAAPAGDDAWLDHIARRLAGQSLKPVRGDEFAGREPPIMVLLSRSGDGVTRRYTAPANVWHSFTPVVLPGHDDHKPNKTKTLIERALRQSGIDQPCEFEWSAFSRFRKAYSAHKYDRDKRLQGYIRPKYLLSQTAVHLTLRFRDGLKVLGPLAIGAGRHCGLGLMASMNE